MFDSSKRMHLGMLAGLGILGFASAVGAQVAQPVIKVVVPFSAGGVTDQIARGVVERVSKSIGRTMVIENRPGAGSRIGSEAVMRAAPDGNTLLFTNSSYSIFPVTDPDVKYDPATALTPVSLAGKYGMPLAVRDKLPATNLNELIAYARKNPGKLTYGSAGIGSGIHFWGEYFQKLTGTQMVHVPYKSTSAAVVDVAGDVLDMTFDATAKTYADAGKVRILAVTGDVRDPRMPGVPTAAESGLKDFVLTSWLGLFAPAGTPAPLVAALNKAVNEALADPEFAKQIEIMGVTPAGGPPATLADFVQKDVALYRRIAADARLNFKE